ncbi:MAG: hypothetical protein DBX61_02210 [Clostridiales bacterium]|nr:MAG: hypothetical protein DBX61_02210 [Clostridiales bacterium]
MDKISNKITDYLCLRNFIPEKDREIYNYGFKLILSDIINFSIVILLGLLTNRILEGIVFLITLCGIRRFSGGFHAKTFWLCRVLMILTFIIVWVITELIYNFRLFFPYVIVVDILALIFIAIFSPIKHPNKKLSKKQVKTNKIKATLAAIVLTVISAFLMTFKFKCGMTVSVTIMAVVFLMIIGMKGGEKGV